MKHLFPLCILMLAGINAIGQSNSRTGLPDIHLSDDSFHYRFQAETRAVDIWTNDFINFKSQGYYWAETSRTRDNYGSPIPIRYYNDNEPLNDSVARALYTFLVNNNILSIPTRDSIKAWDCKACLDGESLATEQKITGKYELKNYWTPYSYMHIPEAAKIDSLYKYIEALFDLRGRWSTFIQSLPRDEYSAGSFFITYSHGPTYKAWLRKQKKK